MRVLNGMPGLRLFCLLLQPESPWRRTAATGRRHTGRRESRVAEGTLSNELQASCNVFFSAPVGRTVP